METSLVYHFFEISYTELYIIQNSNRQFAIKKKLAYIFNYETYKIGLTQFDVER